MTDDKYRHQALGVGDGKRVVGLVVRDRARGRVRGTVIFVVCLIDLYLFFLFIFC